MFENTVGKLENQLAKVKKNAQELFLSWEERPEYFAALDESLAKIKNEAANFDIKLAKNLLLMLLKSRVFHDKILRSYQEGEFKGALLRGFGQEAVGVGVGIAMEKRDIIARDHRSISAAVARGTSVEAFWLSHFMRANSPSGGYDPNIHFADLERNDLGFLISDMSISTVIINGAVWYANAKKKHEKGDALEPKERACGVAMLGDGATSNSITHGGMNFAKASNLPVLFLILDNQISLRTGHKEQHGGIALANRAIGYEMPALKVDGDDVFEMYFASRFLLEFSRLVNHPALLHAETFRRCGHNETEGTGYLKKMYSKETLEFWNKRENDPLYKARTKCEELGFVSKGEYENFLDEIHAEVEAGHQKALVSPDPDPKDFRKSLIDPECKVVKSLAEEHKPQKTERKITFREALREAFKQELSQDHLLHMLGEDLGYPGHGVFDVTAGLPEEFGTDRVANSTLDEAAIAGFLVGAGLMGGRVIVEYQFWNFFLAGANVVLTLAATRPFMQQHGIPGVLRGPMGYAPQSNHYHETWPTTYLLKSLGIKVVVPSTPEDAKGLMKSAIRDPDLVAVLEEMSFYGDSGLVPEGEYFTPFEAIIRKPGKDITLVTWGPKMMKLALDAAQRLENENIEVEVIDLRILRPWDKKTVSESVRKTGRLMVLEEDSGFMGFNAEVITEIVTHKEFYHLKAAIKRLAAKDTPIPGSLILEDERLPKLEDVILASKELMEES